MVEVISKLISYISAICFLVLSPNISYAEKSNEDLFYKEQIFNAHIDRVCELVCDYENYTKYFYHMSKSKTYNFTNNPKVYFEFKVFGRTFWADVILIKTVNIDNSITIKVNTIDTNLKVLDGKWELIPIDEQHTKLIIHGIAKPRMPLPESVLRNLFEEEISYTFRKFNRLL